MSNEHPGGQKPVWDWLDSNVAALWIEIFRSDPDLHESERFAQADAVYNSPEILMQTLAFAEEWDRAAAAARRLVLTEHVVLAARALREVDGNPRPFVPQSLTPDSQEKQFDRALYVLYDSLLDL